LESVTLSVFWIRDKAFLAEKEERVATNMPLEEKAKELLRICIKSIHDLIRRYFYQLTGEESVPGNLSYLLGVKESDMVKIFKACGFYHIKKGTFARTAFKTWVTASFPTGTVEFSSFRRKDLLKLGLGEHPSRPSDQLKENLDPPRFRMTTTTDVEGLSSRDSLMRLFDTSPTGTTTPTATTPAAMTPTASPVKKLSQRFNIPSPDKPKLAMELVSSMDSRQKEPLMRELVKGSTIIVECHNNQPKKYVHIPQCSDERLALAQNVKYQFIREIVNTLGAGAETVAGTFNQGAMWLCRGLADGYHDEFLQSASRAGITCISRMSAKATGAMWTDAKVTKRKSRKISAHLFD
jgi:hypothetical protein